MKDVRYFETDDNRMLWRDLINEIPPYMSGGRENPANLFDIAKKAIEDGDTRDFNYTILATPSKKVAFFNDAAGMDHDKFDWFMRHLSASDPDKPEGGRHNYGIGVRTAALRASPFKVEVFTKRDGQTLHGVFGFDGQGYGPVELANGDLFREVNDFPKWLGTRKEGTLVIQHGSSEHEETAVNATTKFSAPWSMARRWWRIPSNVKVSAAMTASNQGGNFVPLHDAIRPRKTSGMVKQGEYQCVTIAGGIKVHYSLLSMAGSGGKRQIGWANYQKGFGGVVYRDEVYDFREGRSWADVNNSTGLRPIWDQVAVFVELPDSYEVMISKLRDTLKHTEGSSLGDAGKIVTVSDAAALIRHSMPDFIREAVRSATRSIQTADETKQRERLSELLKEMALFDEVVKKDPEGPENTDDVGGGTRGGGGGKGKGSGGKGINPKPRKRDDGDISGSKRKGLMRLFDVEFTSFENGTNGYFLQYGVNADDNPVLYWNTTSRLSDAMLKKVETETAKYNIDSDRTIIEMHKAVKAQLLRKAGDHYVQMYFNILKGGWTDEDKNMALSPASLSLWIGNEIDFQKSVLKTIHNALNMETVSEAA